MNNNESQLRAYYEEEARLGTRSALESTRVELRDEFIRLISDEDRHSIVDFGAGPGGDARGFREAGYYFVGLDLSFGNCVLASKAGNTVIQGSLKSPPFRVGSFDAGWSMSTLMHLPEEEVEPAVLAMAATLKPGAPLCVGVWGAAPDASPVDQVQSDGIGGFSRLFSLRMASRNRQLLEAAGTVTNADTWPLGPEGWQYQTFVLRVT